MKKRWILNNCAALKQRMFIQCKPICLCSGSMRQEWQTAKFVCSSDCTDLKRQMFASHHHPLIFALCRRQVKQKWGSHPAQTQHRHERSEGDERSEERVKWRRQAAFYGGAGWLRVWGGGAVRAKKQAPAPNQIKHYFRSESL